MNSDSDVDVGEMAPDVEGDLSVKYPTSYQASLGDDITIFGITHHAMHRADVDERIVAIDPDVIALERIPHVFGIEQLQFDASLDLDTHWAIAHSLMERTDIALVDRDWSDLEQQYPKSDQDELIEKAYTRVGVDPSDGPQHVSIDEIKAVNQALNELDSVFYTEFVVKRDIAVARYLAGLTEHEEYESIVCLVGHNHLPTVAGITRDILVGEDAGYSPDVPRICTPSELTDVIEPIEKIVEKAGRAYDLPTDEDTIIERLETQRQAYQQQMQSVQ